MKGGEKTRKMTTNNITVSITSKQGEFLRTHGEYKPSKLIQEAINELIIRDEINPKSMEIRLQGQRELLVKYEDFITAKGLSKEFALTQLQLKC